jgi:hypothetical protein
MARVPGSLESAVESRFNRAVKDLGGLSIKLVTGKGMPDRLVMLPNGRTSIVELKKDTGTVEPAQAVWHRKAERLGHHVHVVYGMEGVAQWAQRMLREGAQHGNQR